MSNENRTNQQKNPSQTAPQYQTDPKKLKGQDNSSKDCGNEKNPTPRNPQKR